MKLKAIVGRILYFSLARKLPGSYSNIRIGQRKIRIMTARMFNSNINKNANIENGAIISSKVSVDEYGNIGKDAYIQGTVSIGKYVMMGPECNIWTINHNYSSTSIPMCMQGNGQEKDVVIEDDVWIGARVTILPGTIIKRGTIVGAGSVVRGIIPPYSIIAGNPAVVIRYRTKSEE